MITSNACIFVVFMWVAWGVTCTCVQVCALVLVWMGVHLCVRVCVRIHVCEHGGEGGRKKTGDT